MVSTSSLETSREIIIQSFQRIFKDPQRLNIFKWERRFREIVAAWPCATMIIAMSLIRGEGAAFYNILWVKFYVCCDNSHDGRYPIIYTYYCGPKWIWEYLGSISCCLLLFTCSQSIFHRWHRNIKNDIGSLQGSRWGWCSIRFKTWFT